MSIFEKCQQPNIQSCLHQVSVSSNQQPNPDLAKKFPHLNITNLASEGSQATSKPGPTAGRAVGRGAGVRPMGTLQVNQWVKNRRSKSNLPRWDRPHKFSILRQRLAQLNYVKQPQKVIRLKLLERVLLIIFPLLVLRMLEFQHCVC